ncbi:hypothetical protein NDU88_003302 [Pleurodeles waltl]|uniref:Uncharacterized protein n=1 Tax=Pleurodeles waltl TaxID=8319 RepID=A0AAV7NIV3_PLEWA|nr:hypothetical protein NDU88_003302 [Pleurodeles waltl]
MQDSWLSRKADEIQKYTDSNNSKCFFDALKTIYRPQSPGTSPLLSADGSTLFTDKNSILKRWTEHVNSVLNKPSSINAKAIDCILQVTINTSLAEPSKESEVNRERLWRIMEKFGYPDKFISMVHMFHDGMLSRVRWRLLRYLPSH